MNSRAILFFGRSGCGKGTQAKLLSEVLKSKGREVIYTETGSKFREFLETDNYSGKIVGDILKDGKLIPVFLPIWIWTDILVKNFTGEQDLILDGLCRRREESIALDSAFDFYKIEKPNIILMNVSKDWSYTRMMERQRADDTPEKIQNRLDWYEKDVVPSIEYFRGNPKYNFIEINGEQTIEKVHEDIIKALNF
ncbi:nucleoside monophosphate kinase [Candidatus Nomurabacteria bacterium]|nr:nucleoside monophosphate kinase [Candidatus Nomurabacteria bacterium]